KQRLTAALRAVFGHALSIRSEVMDEQTGGGADVGPASIAPATTSAPAAQSPANMTGEATPTMGDEKSPKRARVGRSANGSDALEGEPLLHEVIATFEGEIVEPAGG